jgi:energy-coupling factor transporter ATP-binding protein EcfA2
MYSNRPLLATTPDSRLFVWSEQASHARQALERGQHTLIVGEPGSGKTSLLHMVEREVREDAKFPACFVSLQHTDDVGEAVALVHRAAHEQGLLAGPADQLSPAALKEDPFAPTQLVRDLGRVRASARMLVDDVSADAGQALFGRLRDELWQLSLVWGVAVGRDDASPLLTPPADAFFERKVSLDELSPEDRLQLLEQRNSYGPDTLSASQLERLAKDGPSNPRRLIGLAREVAEHSGAESPARLFQGVDLRRQRAETVAGRPGRMLVTELESLAPVSASDERLLSRLGWTRNRASEILSRLEDGGVVSSRMERRDGRAGRPRKLYELKSPETFLPLTG